MPIGYCWESQKEGVHYEDQDVVVWIILKWILEKLYRVVWTGLI
jgi:hypothetical protein